MVNEPHQPVALDVGGTSLGAGPSRLTIVGIGASAGGLEAFQKFFASCAPNPRLAYVLVQHLSPEHESMLVSLLAKGSPIPIVEATDDLEVSGNHVYVIPPNATMTITKGRLRITKPAPPREQRRPIDTFLLSLAEDQGEKAIGIILSGTGSDGTLGATAIREHGGLTFAQADAEKHALSGMPQSASASGYVDELLEVDAIPARLAAHVALRSVTRVESQATKYDQAPMATILDLLRSRTGHDFSEYKDKTLLRRLQRRMQILLIDTAEAYIERIRKQPHELDELFRELLIGVTQFFRDPEAFEALDGAVLTKLVASKGADEAIRIWVPGCATGQEAYSLAILLREAMDSRRPKPKVQIFGTDIDDRAITTARLGRYAFPAAGLSEERAERWFAREGADLVIAPEIREMCIFSTHSVIKDPPFSKLDLISCRNLLIYVASNMQDRVMRSFHYALRPGGQLFLGTSESVTRTARLFSAVDKKYRIFERRTTDSGMLPELPGVNRAMVPAAPSAVPAADPIALGARRVMEKFYPPHIVIDDRQQIVSFSGGPMGQYLEPSAGAPSFALFDILRKPLRAPVRALLQELRNADGPITKTDVPVRREGKPHHVTLIAASMGRDTGLAVLAFQDGGVVQRSVDPSQRSQAASETIQALEQELRTTRVQLQSTIDELEIANEEMKPSNEEYQSVNEELQSSNEELETSKEEMQSINEELQTINTEVASKNEVLTHLNSDIKNLLESTDIATLFLDESLRINNFTRGIVDLFNVRDHDIGRPITDINSLLDYSALAADVRSVLRTLQPTRRSVTLAESKTFEMRIRPYRTVDNIISGVVCSFINVTHREAAEAATREREKQFHALAESIPQLSWIMDARGYIFWFNQRWFDYTATTLEEVQGLGWQSVHHPDELERVTEHLEHCVRTGEVWEDTFRLRGLDGTYRWFWSRAQPISDEAGAVVRWFGTHTDIEDQRRGEEWRDLLLREMDHRVKNLFAIVSGMVTLSARAATTPKELAETIRGRLSALATAHNLIRTSKPVFGVRRETTLSTLIRSVLAPGSL